MDNHRHYKTLTLILVSNLFQSEATPLNHTSLCTMNVEDQSVWRAISGPCDIPNVGSIVYYYPRLHQVACQGEEIVADLLLPTRLTAEVLSTRLSANRDSGQDVFVEFLLQPVGDDSPARGNIFIFTHYLPSLFFYVEFCFQIFRKCR